MRFNGSAARMPYEHGLFRAGVTVSPKLAVHLSPHTDFGLASLYELFSVFLHAANQTRAFLGNCVFECSGAAPTLKTACELVTPGGWISPRS